jgi:SAM-dependent methyltransferase
MVVRRSLFVGRCSLTTNEQRPTINDTRAAMPYADITRNDRNPVKRFLQRRRLADALSLVQSSVPPRTIIDFGAGDGELCRLLAGRFPESKIVCYEPTPSLRQEAAVLLSDVSSVVICASVDELSFAEADLLFCLEVFEHLPARQTEEALAAIRRLLAPDGIAVIGVPVEVHAPAIAKGLFRMTRRYGDFDANAKNILRAAAGRPPGGRPVIELSDGAPYHQPHLGFDHRRLRRQLDEHFAILRTVGSPAKHLPAWLNSEVYFVVRKLP